MDNQLFIILFSFLALSSAKVPAEECCTQVWVQSSNRIEEHESKVLGAYQRDPSIGSHVYGKSDVEQGHHSLHFNEKVIMYTLLYLETK